MVVRTNRTDSASLVLHEFHARVLVSQETTQQEQDSPVLQPNISCPWERAGQALWLSAADRATIGHAAGDSPNPSNA